MRKLLLAVLLLPIVLVAQRYDPPITPLTLKLLMAQPHKGTSDADWLKIVSNPANADILSIPIYEDMLDTMDASQLDRRFFYKPMPGRPGGGALEKDPSKEKEIRRQAPRVNAHGPRMPMEVQAN